MKVVAWNNGRYHLSGAGYGFKIKRKDRDLYFSKSWERIFIKLPGLDKEIEVNTKKASFWKSCRQLISKDIGRWLIDSGHIPWPKGYPPIFKLNQVHENRFMLYDK